MADDQIDTLNSLLQTTIDSVEGYQNSAKELSSGRIQEIFQERANDRQQVVQQLREEVRRLGGEPNDSGTAMGGMHHVWEDLKGAVTGHDDKAIIKQTEAAEDYLKEKYEGAIEDLSGDSRQVVERCYQQVRQGHDQISELKHSMEATS